MHKFCSSGNTNPASWIRILSPHIQQKWTLLIRQKLCVTAPRPCLNSQSRWRLYWITNPGYRDLLLDGDRVLPYDCPHDCDRYVVFHRNRILSHNCPHDCDRYVLFHRDWLLYGWSVIYRHRDHGMWKILYRKSMLTLDLVIPIRCHRVCYNYRWHLFHRFRNNRMLKLLTALHFC